MLILRILLAICIACAAWAEINPKDMLSFGRVEPTHRIGGIQRFRFTVENAERQYWVGSIVAKVSWMRLGRDGPAYEVASSSVSIPSVKPAGHSVFNGEMIAPPPCREGETEAGLTVTPVSALFYTR